MWSVLTTDLFDSWYQELGESDRNNVLASLMLVRELGPSLPRPYADTVYGSIHSNMKELRVQSKGKPIRAFFAFDPKRNGIVLCAGNKAGDKRFYERMVAIADREYSAHLGRLKQE